MVSRDQPKPFFTFGQLATRWGVSRAHVFHLARTDGRFPPRTRFGGCARVALPDVEAYERSLRGTDAARDVTVDQPMPPQGQKGT